MDSIPLAKQSAALNACRRLHEIGELTDDLQPVSIKNVLQNVDFLFPNWENEKIDGAPGERLPGTTSKKRVHSIEVSITNRIMFSVVNLYYLLTPLRHISSILVVTFSFLTSEENHSEACDLAS